jgi:metallo-beta-lactamase family protein
VLLDCGLYQGKRKEAFELNRNLPFDPKTLDALVLSHAHIDHSGNLPTLVRRGFQGSLFATPATIDLCEIMLQDSARLQVHDVEYVNEKRRLQGKNPFEPLYEPADVDHMMKHFAPVPYETPKEIVPGITITFPDAGHILGSAITEIRVRENGASHYLLFTGDLGRKDMPILRDPVVVSGADTVITESTYGNRVHETGVNVEEKLRTLVNEVAARKSRLIIPAFSVGRTQQILYMLDDLYTRKQVADIPVYVDSPLSNRATEVYERHRECFDEETLDRLKTSASPFAFPRLKLVTEVQDSKALNHAGGPMVVISASGMCEGGRILHHLEHGIEDARNVVLFVGYQAQNTLGRYLVDGRQQVRIYGEEYRVCARIEKIEALSAHADRNGLLDLFTTVGPSVQRAFVVHGELDSSEALAGDLRKMGVPSVTVPAPGEVATI